jgi:hypothetical protein
VLFELRRFPWRKGEIHSIWGENFVGILWG